MKPQMLPWAQAPIGELRSVRGVCLDIDETLSTHGKLTARAYAALSALKEHGFLVVPVTGRPAGWCDHIARFWPVDAVVGENGAFAMYMQDGKLARVDTPGAPAEVARRAKLQGLGEAVRARFPQARWASDQPYREFDLAIDFCEDVPPWKDSDVRELVKLCEAEGAHAKVSSIHVNAWFGDYDKRSGFDHWMDGRTSSRDQWLFIGDSPNDEPMFAHFKRSVAVANLARFQDQLKSLPRWITSRESGEGFAEMVNRLIVACHG